MPTIVAAATDIAASTGGSTRLERDPAAAVAGADVVVTDTWVSMGTEGRPPSGSRPWRRTPSRASCSPAPKDDAIVLHCLPAYRGKEIDAGVIDGPQSVVWDEAENRRHAQKAILAWLQATA